MKLLGPIFWYDLTRVARRQNLALWRTVYASLMLVALYLLYLNSFPQAAGVGNQQIPRERLSELATFGNYIFVTFAILQFAAVVLITPALTAGALAEERSKNTLAFLLTSQLTSREIVLGKLFTRLMQVGLLVLTGLPMLGILQLFGGVDQLLIVAAFVGAGITAVSVGAVGVACAVFVKRPQNAAIRAYQWIVLYAVLTTGSMWVFDLPVVKRIVAARPLVLVRLPNRQFTFAPAPAAPIVPLGWDEKLIELVHSGNPYFAAERIRYESGNSRPITGIVPQVMVEFAVTHSVIAALCIGLAVWKLRSVSARHISGVPPKKSVYAKPVRHPPIKNRPVLWKELYCESRPRQRWLAQFFSRWFFCASFAPTTIFIILGIDEFRTMNAWLHSALCYGGTLVTCGLLLRVGIQAARSIGGERDRESLDSLLSTQLDAVEIVRDKWWGSFLAGRWMFLWLFIHWVLGLGAFALNPVSFSLLVVETIAFGAFIVSFGLYFSVVEKTTKRAVAQTCLYGLVATTVAPWFIEQAVAAHSLQTKHQPGYRVSLIEISVVALSPVRILYETVDPEHGMYPWYVYGHFWFEEVVPAALISIALYTLMAIWLFVVARARFRHRHRIRQTLGHQDAPRFD